MNARLESIGRTRPHPFHPLSFAWLSALAVAVAVTLTGPTPAAASGASTAAGAGDAATSVESTSIGVASLPGLTGAQVVDGVASAPADPSSSDAQPLSAAVRDAGALVAAGFEPAPAGGIKTEGGAAAGSDGIAAAYAPYVERAWTTDGYGRAKTEFGQGERARLYFTEVNPAWNWQSAYLRLSVRMNIVCITTPCEAQSFVLLQGYKWFPPGRATYYLPVVIERTDPLGNYIFEARVGDTAATANFAILGASVPDPAASGVILYDGAEYTGRTVVVGAGNWQLPTGFRPRSLRFAGAFTTGWAADLYQTICPFAPPCFYQLVATYRSDQPDLGAIGTGPYRLSVHR